MSPDQRRPCPGNPVGKACSGHGMSHGGIGKVSSAERAPVSGTGSHGFDSRTTTKLAENQPLGAKASTKQPAEGGRKHDRPSAGLTTLPLRQTLFACRTADRVRWWKQPLTAATRSAL